MGKNEARRSALAPDHGTVVCDPLRRLNRMHATPEESIRIVAAQKKKAQDEYGAASITILEGLEAVRKRPGMYIGSTGERGLHHLIWEVVDNAVDEAMAGYATTVNVVLLEDGGVEVADDGRGIPVATHASGIPTVDVVMTQLHAGGKFRLGRVCDIWWSARRRRVGG